MDMSGHPHATDALPQRKKKKTHSTHYRGRWVGPRADLDAVGKIEILSPPLP